MGLRALSVAAVIAVLGALGACDYVAQKELVVGQSTVEDVRQLMGMPETIREQSDGSAIHEYPRGPAGTQAWMVRIDSSGRYQGMTDALTPQNLARVKPGMTRDEVRALLGKPGEVGKQVWAKGLVMTWRVQTGPGETEMFHAELGPDGRVVKVDRSPDPQTINTR